MTAVIGFGGYSGSGKTTLITRLAEYFERNGLRVAVIKHDAHGHYKEVAGTDSAAFISSGASAVFVVSPDRVASFTKPAISLKNVLEHAEQHAELILVEGFKQEGHPKLAIFRDAEQASIVQKLSPGPIAWVTPCPGDAKTVPEVPVFHPDDITAIARFIESRMQLKT
jgi:molybdopterin-guanine dinucleotide biosynthesis adapter protein